MSAKTFWFKPAAIELGTDGGYKFVYSILDEQHDMEGLYEYVTLGKQVNYADPFSAPNNSNWDYTTDRTKGTRNQWTDFSDDTLGIKFTTVKPTEFNLMEGRASLTIRPLEEMRPPVYNPVACEFHLLIQGWIHLRANLKTSWVQYGHFEHGNVTLSNSKSNVWFDQNYGPKSTRSKR
jgi:hypothetical protein